MYLSYSGRKRLKECLFAYWNSYINSTPIEGDDDRLGSIFGSVVGLLFEDFYKLRLWKDDQPQGKLVERIDAAIAKVIRQETTATRWRKAGVLKWRDEENPKAMYANVEELAADVRDTVARGFRIIRHNRLLGPVAKTEVKLDITIDGHTLGGRADFIIKRTRPHRDLGIYDGKGSKYRDKYVDEEQLRWYEMLFRQKTGETPDQLGWIFWRFDPPEGFEPVAADETKATELLETTLEEIKDVERRSAEVAPKDIGGARKVFLPKVEDESATKAEVEQACRFCPFATEQICPKGAEFRAAKGWT